MARKYFSWKVTFSMIFFFFTVCIVEGGDVTVAVRNLTGMGEDLEYTGCMSTWTNQNTVLKTSGYNEGLTPESCAEACIKDWGARYNLIYLKGGVCRCGRKFASEKIAAEICNIPCAMKDLDPEKWPYKNLPDFPCGGNFGYSLYQRVGLNSEGQDLVKVEVTQAPSPASTVFAWSLESECMTWVIPKDFQNPPDFFSPEISYFPVNSPEDCAKFCGNPLNLSGDPDDVRNAFRFAMLFWWRPFLSVCKCASEELRSKLVEAPDSSHCSEMCLGDYKMKCGGRREKVGASWVQYVTVYCIESEATGSHTCKRGPSPPTSPPTSPPSPTTEISELKSTSITEITPIKTTQRTPVKNCEKIDPITGHHWIVAPGQNGTKNCKKIFPGSCGVAFWHCAGNGTFLTETPDLSNCSSCWLRDKFDELDRISNTTGADNLAGSLKTQVKGQSQGEASYIGPDITHILSLGEEVVAKTTQEFSPLYSELFPVVQKIVEVNAYLLQNHPPWNHLSVQDKSQTVTQLITTSESALFHLTNLTGDDDEKFVANPCENCSTITRDNFLVFAERHEIGENDFYQFPNKSATQRWIKLPPGWNNGLSQFTPVGFLEMAGISADANQIGTTMLGHNETKIINGGLISLTVNNRRISLGGIEILFKHDVDAWGQQRSELLRKLHPGEKAKAVQGSARCSFWDTRVNRWSTEGCHLKSSSRLETVCECNHLTAFAVLMDVHQYVGKDFVLELLTLVLTLASEICLLLTIVLLSYVSIGGLQRIRATIIKNLSVCLMLGNGMVVFVLDRNYFHMTEDVCMASAMITHYIFLAAFMWMLIEGVQLFRMIIHVFDAQRRSYIKHFGVFAYGSPVIVVAVTAMAGYLNGDNPYGGDIYCWLEGPYIWAFMGPVALIITTNLVILIVALKTSFQLEMKKDIRPKFLASKVKSYNNFFRTKFRGCMSLTVVLGLTWSVGYFQLQSNSKGQVVAAYAFTILNASQGIFIFLFNWRIFNDKLKRVSQQMKILPSWFSPDSSGTGSSSSSGGSPQGGYRHRAKLSVASVQFYGVAK